MKLQSDVCSSTVSDSALVPSKLFNIYPIERAPANLRVNGYHTVKDMAKKSFKHSEYLNVNELKFAARVLDSMFVEFGSLNTCEVVKGNSYLAGLNKDSSSGYGYSKVKEDYIDFEKGEITPLFESILLDFRNKLKDFEYPKNHLLWVECLKDEVRNVEKVDSPRTFRIGTLLNQFLTKKYFGNFVVDIIKNREFNQIMVGVNPYKEWQKIHDNLKSCDGVFAGDIKNWDGSMLPQVQRLVVDKIMEYYVGEGIEEARLILDTIVHSLVVIQDDFYLTTHSMPSGSFLTAILNSVVNKVYTALWYYRTVDSPSVFGFWADVVDYVYGDDKLNGIRNGKGKYLNAISMRDFFNSIGMGFTDSMKKEITIPFQSLDEVTFLKRNFVYHNLLKRIMCPLDLRTIKSTLSWCDGKKDETVVLKDKVHAVQREFFLHHDRDHLLSDLYNRLNSYNFIYEKLTYNYLTYLYKEEADEIPFGFGWASALYN